MKHSYNWNGIGDISGQFFGIIKRNAVKRKLEFNITKEQIWDLYLKQNKKCALSGLDISFKDNTASLDRIDSSKGYIIDNIQWVHKDINMMKNVLSINELMHLCRLIIKWNKK